MKKPDPAIPYRALRAIQTLETDLADISKAYRERIKCIEKAIGDAASETLDQELKLDIGPEFSASNRLADLIDNPKAGL